MSGYMIISSVRLQLLSISIAALFFHCFGHTSLHQPRPYNRNYNPGFYPDGCKTELGQNQCLACPKLKYFEEDNLNSEDSPEVTWQRNERTTISWARNNHAGGFVRFALVPVSDMWNKTAQSAMAFYYGCFENNEDTCATRGGCGSDLRDRYFRVSIKIPNHIPDGVYVFSFVWYGGLRWNISNGYYADYYSCSFVRIRGGGPVAEEFQPYFNRGWKAVHTDPNGYGRCLTAFSEPGRCVQRRQCTNTTPFYSVPKPFQFGRKPGSIPSSMFA